MLKMATITLGMFRKCIAWRNILCSIGVYPCTGSRINMADFFTVLIIKIRHNVMDNVYHVYCIMYMTGPAIFRSRIQISNCLVTFIMFSDSLKFYSFSWGSGYWECLFMTCQVRLNTSLSETFKASTPFKSFWLRIQASFLVKIHYQKSVILCLFFIYNFLMTRYIFEFDKYSKVFMFNL